MADIIVITDGEKRRAAFREGETYLALFRRAGIAVNAECGGLGTCGKCTIALHKNGVTRYVPACRTAVDPSWTAEVPAQAPAVIEEEDAGSDAAKVGGKSAAPDAAAAGRRGAGTASAAAGEEGAALPGGSSYTAAVDLGTSTVAVRVFPSGCVRRRRTCTQWNAQRTYGADVITRIQYIQEHPEGLADLSQILWKQILKMACGLLPEGAHLDRIFLAGNTIMQHIAAGLSPVGIAHAPFRPETLFTEDSFFPDPVSGTPVWYAPCAAGYVGGDITAGLYASGLPRRRGTFLYLDIGTNGEMALIRDGRITCCAAATGPAFEGSGIACGMTGVSGAISHVRWTGSTWQTDVIGGGKARGICGSGLIELLALLVRYHVLSGNGRLLPPDELPLPWSQFMTADKNGDAVLHLIGQICLTADDVRTLQLARAAVAAGIDVLLKENGIGPAQIDETILAGGFGTHLDPQSAADAGMLPAGLVSRTSAIGNASLAGITAAAADAQAREEIRQIQESCTYLELSGSDLFSQSYLAHMDFYPEYDEEE